MTTTLKVYDERATGAKLRSISLTVPGERMTVRELIRERIYQEVQDYNLQQTEYFNGLVAPNEAEQTLNGYRLRTRRSIDWQEQFQRALESFERNGFFILIDDKQAGGLDEEFDVSADTEVSFVKLVPLVGG